MARRESVQSLCAVARRAGRCLVVLGESNTAILCEFNHRSGLFTWFVDGYQCPPGHIPYLLEQLQDEPAQERT